MLTVARSEWQFDVLLLTVVLETLYTDASRSKGKAWRLKERLPVKITGHEQNKAASAM